MKLSLTYILVVLHFKNARGNFFKSLFSFVFARSSSTKNSTVTDSPPPFNGTDGQGGFGGPDGLPPFNGTYGIPYFNGTDDLLLLNGTDGLPPINGTDGHPPFNGFDGQGDFGGPHGFSPFNGTDGFPPFNATDGFPNFNGTNDFPIFNGTDGFPFFNGTDGSSPFNDSDDFGGPDHDGPGGFGGPGKHGPPAPPGVKFFNDTCPADSSTDSPCLVGPPGNETGGSWVCRTLYDIVTGDSRSFSACVERTQFIETDTCGCCGSECPSLEPCVCACNITGPPHEHRTLQRGMRGWSGGHGGRGGDFGGDFNATGVLVTVGDTTQCVPANISVKLITGPGFFGPFSCVTECN